MWTNTVALHYLTGARTHSIHRISGTNIDITSDLMHFIWLECYRLIMSLVWPSQLFLLLYIVWLSRADVPITHPLYASKSECVSPSMCSCWCMYSQYSDMLRTQWKKGSNKWLMIAQSEIRRNNLIMKKWKMRWSNKSSVKRLKLIGATDAKHIENNNKKNPKIMQHSVDVFEWALFVSDCAILPPQSKARNGNVGTHYTSTDDRLFPLLPRAHIRHLEQPER